MLLRPAYVLHKKMKCMSTNWWNRLLARLVHIHHKTYLYNFEPLKPHFYIVKLGFTGVYIIFLISAQNIYYEYSLEQPRRGGSNEYPQSMFWAEIWKISEFLSENFRFFGGEIFSTFEQECFLTYLYALKTLIFTCQCGSVIITKTRLYNSDPLEPHFYIVKLGFTGVCIIFLISA